MEILNIRADLYSGYELSTPFNRKVNKRLLPDYFDVIKEPMAFSTIRVSKLAIARLTNELTFP